jgi:hypothetical protein
MRLAYCCFLFTSCFYLIIPFFLFIVAFLVPSCHLHLHLFPLLNLLLSSLDSTLLRHCGHLFHALLTFFLIFYSSLFLTAHSTSTDSSSSSDEVTDLYLVHSNMAILNLVSQVHPCILSYSILFYTLLISFISLRFVHSLAASIHHSIHDTHFCLALLCFTLPFLLSCTSLYSSLLSTSFLLSSLLHTTPLLFPTLSSLLLSHPAFLLSSMVLSYLLFSHSAFVFFDTILESDSISPREEVRTDEDVTISRQHYF